MLKSLLSLLAITLFFLLAGCTKRPSPEQLTNLDAALRSAEAAETELAALEIEYAELSSELERAKQILAENESELETVKIKLGN